MRFASILAGVLTIAATSAAAVPHSFAERGYDDNTILARDHHLIVRDVLHALYARTGPARPGPLAQQQERIQASQGGTTPSLRRAGTGTDNLRGDPPAGHASAPPPSGQAAGARTHDPSSFASRMAGQNPGGPSSGN
ncbi:hypothetical protein EIP91_011691 [Steccherinum ochraceum]|uniref:Uncharacterized protein n=1 Tax=Steccherinum ochraceum TaxID=92696 RepID=A0A4R0RUI7_9APHY|nr:hypothetical protein EIP91_011691 [Steccherinum ochraceum]